MIQSLNPYLALHTLKQGGYGNPAMNHATFNSGKPCLTVLILLFLLVPVFIFSQGFGFGDAADPESRETTASVSGEVAANLTGFFNDFNPSKLIDNNKPEDIFEGKFNFSISGRFADWSVNLKFCLEPSPIVIDEAFVRFYLGSVDLEAGVRKLTWGRADSFGPLDVINPIDYSDLTALGNPRNIKIARPMLHVSWNINTFSKLEGVFIPWFAGHEYAMEGRWAPVQITALGSSLFDIKDYYKNSNETLNYGQGGLRFTTTIGETDVGAQYYFGRFPRPAYSIDLRDFLISYNPDDIQILVMNNYYHHIGVDYARVIAGFNIRAEAGVNITGDLKGDDGAVYNPQVVWSLGFDRDLLWGINLNLQGNGLVRLMYDKIGTNSLMDTEAGANRSSTRITAILSRQFFQDELTLKTTALWGIEDSDFYIIPAIVWSKNDITAELSVGLFGGDKAGELGQYRDNCYVKTVVSYSF